MSKKVDSFCLFSNDTMVTKKLELLIKQNKFYFSLISMLRILGDFDHNIEVNLYEIIDTDDLAETILYCTDKNECIFLFKSDTSERKSQQKLKKISNLEEMEYDAVLAKKSIITSENIDLFRTGNVFDFKFGRLISDKKSFYSVFLGNNISYQIIGNFGDITNELLKKMNNITDKYLTFQQFLNIVESSVSQTKISNNKFEISIYKDFERVDHMSFDENPKTYQIIQ